MTTTSTPVIAWNQQFGSSASDSPSAVASASDGTTYVVGHTSGIFNGVAKIGTLDGFITKFDQSGQSVWTTLMGVSGKETSAKGVAVSADGSLFVVGVTMGALYGQPFSGLGNAFISKFNTDGKEVWTRLLVGTGQYPSAAGSAVAISSDGSVYLVGFTNSNLDGQTFSGGTGGDIFLSKFSLNGTKLWTRILGTSNDERSSIIATAPDGSVYVGGQTAAGLSSETYNGGFYDGFVTKFDSNGNRVWTRLIGNSLEDTIEALAVAQDGTVYAAGATYANLDGQLLTGSRDGFVVKFGSDGSRAWTRLVGSPGQAVIPYGLAVDSNGNISIAGQTTGGIDGQPFGGSWGDAFISQYDSNGTRLWTKQIGTSLGEAALDLSVAPDNSLLIAGVKDVVQNGILSADVFLTKLAYSSPIMPAAPTYTLLANQTAVNEGSTATFTVSTTNVASGTSLAYTLSGVSASDITGGSLSGTTTVGSNGQATISVPIAADQSTEGNETLTVTVQGKTSSTTVVDTTVPQASVNVVQNPVDGHWYELVSASVNWEQALASAATRTYRGLNGYLAAVGSEPENALIRTLLKAGAQGYWLGASDAGSQGRWTWRAGPESGQTAGYTNFLPGEPTGSSGEDYLEVWGPSRADGSFAGYWNDIFLSGSGEIGGYIVEYGGLPATYTITPSATLVNEGSSVTFTLDTKNVEWGTTISYTLAGITQSDLASGSLTGTASVNQNGIDGRATITVNISSDQTTEGAESLRLVVGSTTSSAVMINDTSTTPITTTPLTFNDHYYDYISQSGITWENALAQASTKSYRGLGGYLVTVTSKEENLAVYSAFKDLPAFDQGIWLGGSDRDKEGTWKWMAGPELGQTFQFQAWSGTEPNDDNSEGFLGNQDYVDFFPRSFSREPGAWADIWNDPGARGSQVVGGYVVEFGGLAPSYQITSSASSINEGSSVTFTVDTKNVEWGKTVSYTLTGISQSDLASGSLTGTATVNQNGVDGRATVTVSLAADQVTEGNELLRLTVGSTNSSSVTINDTSIQFPTYSIASVSPSVNEGSTASFIVSTSNVASGTALAYTLSGVSASDITGGSLSGTTTVGSNGQATISVPIAADQTTEGNETLTVTVQGKTASTAIFDTSTAPVLPTYSLSANQSSVNEGSSASFTISTANVTGGTAVPYTLSGVTAADVVGGSLSGAAIIASNGQATISIPIAADQTTEGAETLTVTAQGTTASTTISDTSLTPAETYALDAKTSSVNEGSTAEFTVLTTNVAAGTSLNYNLSGVSSSDIVGGSLSGSVVVASNGQATISLPISADLTTEGDETFVVSLQGKTSSVTIKDTSLTPPATYLVTARNASVNEGSNAEFSVTTTNVAAGTQLDYTLSGVSASDVVGGSLSGTTTVAANGPASITVPIAADLSTEGTETLTVTVQGKTASTSILDTSLSPQATYELSALTQSVTEGATASFLLTTTNVPAGRVLTLTGSGLGVTSSDLVGRSLTGTTSVGTNGQSTITIPIEEDTLVEGTEILTIKIADATASVQIFDKVFWTDINGSLQSDTINGSSSADRISGLDSDDVLSGLGGDDSLSGGAGADSLSGGDGVDLLDGGLGSDVALFGGSAGNYVLSRNAAGQITVADKFGTADFLVNVQYLKFDDQVIDTRSIGFVPTVMPTGLVNDDIPAVFRFYNASNNAYFYTINIAEKRLVLRESTDASYEPSTGVWSFFYQGSTFEVARPGQANITPVYRFFNTTTGHYLFTTSVAERDNIQKESTDPNYGQPGLWPFRFEGVAFDAYAAMSSADSIPVYRFFSPSLNRHFFTGDPVEASQVRSSGQYNDEGIGFYAEPVSPTHRITGITTVPTPDAADVPAPPTYNVIAVAPSYNEGTVGQFKVTTSNVAAGTALTYVLSGQGITPLDVTGGLTGQTTVTNGEALVNLALVADAMSEGPESLVVTIEGKTAEFTINDTSPTPQPIDPTPPILLGVIPQPGSKDVAVNQNVIFSFNENIAKGSGIIQLTGSGGSVIESFNVQTSSRLTWIATQLTLDPTADLADGQTYRIVIPTGAIDDLVGNDFAGTSFEVTTVGMPAPPGRDDGF